MEIQAIHKSFQAIIESHGVEKEIAKKASNQIIGTLMLTFRSAIIEKIETMSAEELEKHGYIRIDGDSDSNSIII